MFLASSLLRAWDILDKGTHDTQKVIIPGTAHHPNIEKPEEFNRILLDFSTSLNIMRA
jgi:pimeloyl-ACP methyl ester carboxylesterase